MHKRNLMISVALSVSCLLVTACGGGGGGDMVPDEAEQVVPSPPPPPPPTPENSAPSASAVATPNRVAEGEMFALDASQSVDPDGDPLSFSWTQISGPSVDLGAGNQARIANILVPEVGANVQAIFRVAVSDGERSTSADVPVDFEDTYHLPRYSADPVQIATATFLDGNYTVTLDAAASGTAVTAEAIQQSLNDVSKVMIEAFTSDPDFQVMDGPWTPFDPGFKVRSRLVELIYGMGYKDAEFLARFFLEPSFERVRVFGEDGATNRFDANVDLIDVPQACAMNWYRTQWRAEWKGDKILGLLAVGQRGSGLSVLQHIARGTSGPTLEAFQSLGLDESFCAVQFINRPAESVSFNNQIQQLPHLIALDTEAANFHVFKPELVGASAFKFVESSVVPVGLDGAPGLGLVDARPWQDIPANDPKHQIWTLLFSDGASPGTHRLVVAWLDADGRLFQQAASWSSGVPVAFGQGRFEFPGRAAGITGRMIPVLVEGSPEMMVFEVQESDPARGVVFPGALPAYFTRLTTGTIFASDMTIDRESGRFFFSVDSNDRLIRVYESPS